MNEKTKKIAKGLAKVFGASATVGALHYGLSGFENLSESSGIAGWAFLGIYTYNATFNAASNGRMPKNEPATEPPSNDGPQ